MSIFRRKERTELFVDQNESMYRYYELRKLAARTLNPVTVHRAGGGSEYVYIGDDLLRGPVITVRFADHENISFQRDTPDYNCVNRELTREELTEIENDLRYPDLAMKVAFAKHVGLSVPKLKKMLDHTCLENVCPDPFNYPNTLKELVVTGPAIQKIADSGITTRLPVKQERWQEEDYSGVGMSLR